MPPFLFLRAIRVYLFLRRWRQTGLNVGTGLNSTNHRGKILFEGYEVFAAKQNGRAGTCPG